MQTAVNNYNCGAVYILLGAYERLRSGDRNHNQFAGELGDASAFSKAFQKDSGAPVETFGNGVGSRFGSFIVTDLNQELEGGQELSIQAEHPLEREYIRQLVGGGVVIEYTRNPLGLLKEAKGHPDEIAALIANLSILKDDVVVQSEKGGRGIERYKDCQVEERLPDGSYRSLPAGVFYKDYLCPVKEIIDNLLNGDVFLRLLHGEITFADIKELFKKDSPDPIDVDIRDNLSNLWDNYTTLRGIDKVRFPDPLIVTPDFYRNLNKH